MKRRKIKYSIPCKFRYLHPLKQLDLPRSFVHMHDIASRAQTILLGKSEFEIMDIWRTANGVIRKQARKSGCIEINPVSLLSERVDEKHRKLVHPYAKHPISNYFAVLALSLLDDALHALDTSKKLFLSSEQRGGMLDVADRNIYAGNFVTEAMYAISVAEHFEHEIKKYSNLEKKGAAKKNAPNRELREFAIQLFREKSWPSANKAAHDLKDTITTHARKIGVHLTDENAQRTIAEWFRKSV